MSVLRSRSVQAFIAEALNNAEISGYVHIPCGACTSAGCREAHLCWITLLVCSASRHACRKDDEKFSQSRVAQQRAEARQRAEERAVEAERNARQAAREAFLSQR